MRRRQSYRSGSSRSRSKARKARVRKARATRIRPQTISEPAFPNLFSFSHSQAEPSTTAAETVPADGEDTNDATASSREQVPAHLTLWAFVANSLQGSPDPHLAVVERCRYAPG